MSLESAASFWRYVPHPLVAAYETLGWQDRGPAPGHHGEYAHIMVWVGDEDEPIEPEARP